MAGRRVAAWLAWWVPLMSIWLILADAVTPGELLAGAGAAAVAAATVEWVTGQAGIRFRFRARWLVPAARLPWEVLRDTGIVFAALWRRVTRGEQPASALRELPARRGGTDPESVTRRVLLMGGRSLAPNAFALGLAPGRDVLIVHELVPPAGTGPGPGAGPGAGR